MDFFEHIEGYKSGNLESDLRAEFESAMEKDASLKLAVENHDLAAEIASGLVEIEAAEILESIRKEKKIKQLRILRWGSIAAIGFLLISSILVFDMFTNGNKSEQMATAYYENPENSTTRSTVVPTDLLDQGIYFYHLNEWEKSDSIFQVVFDQSKSEVAAYYLANIRFNTGKYEQVTQYTSTLASEQYLEKGRFLNGLASLAIGDIEKAKNIFTSIVSREDTKAKEAQEILEKLK